MAKALPTIKKLISKLVESRSKIPTWVLTSFNDPDVKLVKKTNNVKELRSGLKQLKYGGGGDLDEEAFRGALPGIWTWHLNNFPGIEVTLNNMPDQGVILVVTDAGTKHRELAKAIKKKSGKKNIKIFIAFSPRCLASELCSLSMPSYNRVSEGRIFNMTAFNRKKFFESVVYEVIYLTTRIHNSSSFFYF